MLTRRDQLLLRKKVKGKKKRGPKAKAGKKGKGIKRSKSKPLSPSKRRRAVLREKAGDQDHGDEDDECEGESNIDAKPKAKAKAKAKASAKKAATSKAKAKAQAKCKAAAVPKGKAKAKSAPKAKAKGKPAENESEIPLAKGTKKISPQKEIILKPAALCMFEALDWYFGVKDPSGLKGIVVEFAKKWGSGSNDNKFKHDLKGDLDEIWYSGYNMYWNRPAAGLLHKESGKELGYFSIPPTRSSNCSWAQKMAVVAKAASMFGKYTDSLIYDGYVDSAKPDTSKDLVIMRNVFKSVVQDAVKKLSESQ